MQRKNWIAASAALGLLSAGSLAQACTLGAWSIPGTGDAIESDIEDGGSNNRFSGKCSMVAGEMDAGWVTDFSPGNEGQMQVRFYVRPVSLTGGLVELFAAYADPDPATNGAVTYNTPVFSVVYNTNGGTIHVREGGEGGTPGTPSNGVAAALGSWHGVEVDWGAGTAGEISLSVNGVADTSPVSITSTDSVNLVRLGMITTGGGTAYFDDYQANRTTEPGRLCRCDAASPQDNTIAINDAVAVVNEIIGTAVAGGQADCSGDGVVAINDAVSMVNTIISAPGALPNCDAQ